MSRASKEVAPSQTALIVTLLLCLLFVAANVVAMGWIVCRDLSEMGHDGCGECLPTP